MNTIKTQSGFSTLDSPTSSPRPKTTSILGTRISLVQIESAIDHIANWVRDVDSHYVCVPDVYQVVVAHDNESHKSILNNADMVVPDGTPLVWVSRLRGHQQISRVAGPDLLPAVCEYSANRGWRHYFYGGADGVAEALANRLTETYPGLEIAGFETPPFRPLTTAEDEAAIDRINAAKPDIVWVGLGCPKQEEWMASHVSKIENAVLIGVGAAFDFHTDRVRRAPRWMQENGLEWLHRLASEPRRLWRRYVIYAPRFVFLVLQESLSANHRLKQAVKPRPDI